MYFLTIAQCIIVPGIILEKNLLDIDLNHGDFTTSQSLKKCEPYKRHITLVSIHTAFELNSSDQTVTIAYMTLNITILRINQRCRQYFGLWKQHHLKFHEPSSSSNMLYTLGTENDNVNSLPLQGMWVFFFNLTMKYLAYKYPVIQIQALTLSELNVMWCNLNDMPDLIYPQTSDIRRILVCNKIVDHSGVVETSSVGAAPTSSFST